MMIVGDCSIFALCLAPAADARCPERVLRSVSIYVDGVNFTESDPTVHVSTFIYLLRLATKRLGNLKLELYERFLKEENPKTIHNRLFDKNCTDANKDKILDDLIFMDFGDTTFHLLSLFVPLSSGDWITCQAIEDYDNDDRGKIHSVPIDRNDLMKILSDAAYLMEKEFQPGGERALSPPNVQ